MKKSKKKYKHSLAYTIATFPLVAIFVILLYAVAGCCYLVEHIYNLCTGKGWTGYSLK